MALVSDLAGKVLPSSVRSQVLETWDAECRSMSAAAESLSGICSGSVALPGSVVRFGAQLSEVAQLLNAQAQELAKVARGLGIESERVAALLSPMAEVAKVANTLRPSPTDYARALLDGLNRRQRRHKSSGLRAADALGAVRLGDVAEVARAVWAGRDAIAEALGAEWAQRPEVFACLLVMYDTLALLDEITAEGLALSPLPTLNRRQRRHSASTEPEPSGLSSHRASSQRSTLCAHSRRHLVTATTTDDPDSPNVGPHGVTLSSFTNTRRLT